MELSTESRKSATRRIKQLLKQKSQLSALNNSLADKAEDQVKQLEKLKEMYVGVTDNATKDTEMVVSQLWNLNNVIEELLTIHTVESKENEEEVFLSKLSTNDYFKAEEEFTSSLTAYTRKQFFEGIAEMAGAKDKLRYEIMEVTNPESLLIKGESEDVLKNKCKELARLQSVYTKSQMDWCESHCDLRKVQSYLYKMEENISKIVAEPPCLDADFLSSRVTQLQKQCGEEGRQLKRIFEDELVPLIEEMSELQSTKILSGNFDLKIARQNYFISKQDMVIEQLLLQNSRYELLSMLYEIEAKSHRDTYHLLSTAKSFLDEEKSSVKSRLSDMIPYTEKKPPRETLDSRDVFMQNIYKAVEDERGRSEQKHFVTCEMLKKNFEKFISKKSKKIGSDDFNQKELVESLREKLQQCASYIQKSENPNLDGQDKISENIAKIEDVLQTLEKSVKSAITDIDRKKKVLETDSLKAMDREIFPNFFNDPNRLQRMMAELRTRVETIEQ